MKTLLFTFLSLICFSANAVKVTDLYHTVVPLTDTSKESVVEAQSNALAEIFIRVSGQKEILSNEEIRAALKHANQYVTGEMQRKEGDELFLALDFSDDEIAKTLSKAKATLWGSNRPQTLIWQVTSRGHRKIEWDQKPDDYTRAIKKQAGYRGLPVLLPIGDLEDVNSVSVSDIWGGFIEPILTSSQRYMPDSLLVTKLVHMGVRKEAQSEDTSKVPLLLQDPAQAVKPVSVYRLSWQFYDQNPSSLMEASAAIIEPQKGLFTGTLNEVYRQLFDLIADEYASRYAISLSGQSISSIDLEIENVKTSQDYYKLERILKAMSSVQSYYPTFSDGEIMEVKVSLKTSVQNFMNELSLNNQLKKVHTETLSEDSAISNYTRLYLK